jgi:hypothetical protein
MKKKSTSQLVRHSLGEGRSATSRRGPWLAVVSRRRRLGEGGFFNLRVLLAFVFCLAGVLMALGGVGLYLGSSKAQAQPGAESATVTANSPNGPDIVRLVGPVVVNADLRDLPYIPPAPQILKQLLVPHQWAETGALPTGTPRSAQFPALITGILQPVPTMPPPLLTFDGISRARGGNGVPPDTNGDVGPNHYVQAVNDAFKVFDKNRNTLSGPTTFNSFFAPLGSSNPCGARQNHGDPFVFYDQLADRWVITDFAHPEFPGSSFWECIGVSRSGDPVAGGWFLYALQADPANPTRKGDYPKFGLWPDAFYLTMNEEEDPRNNVPIGVRVYALDRASMIGGRPSTAVGFTITSELGRPHSLVPASFRTGAPPPVGRQEFLLAIGRSGGEAHIDGWLFHVDFINPSNSTLGLGSDHSPNVQIIVNGFIQPRPFLVPQQGTDRKLDTLGNRIMTPVVYQNRNGTESLWADHTILLNDPDGPTAIRWYQFDVTGGNFPDTPVQQQDWSNGNDGLWRWMPSIAVDENGNTAIGYSISSPSMFPGIRYAGRFATDPLNDLGQGEAIMTNGGGSQTGENENRWGDYTMTTVDPADGISFWHTNEYYVTKKDGSDGNWSTRIGKFQFPRSTLGNISARAFVQTGDNVMIGGFMVQGSQPKRVIIRAIGPELTPYGVPDALANPTLELHDGTGALIASNNNWATTIIGGVITSNQVHEIQASGYVPGDPLESAIIADLPEGNYTAIVRGVNNLTGVALVEVYDLQ